MWSAIPEEAYGVVGGKVNNSKAKRSTSRLHGSTPRPTPTRSSGSASRSGWSRPAWQGGGGSSPPPTTRHAPKAPRDRTKSATIRRPRLQRTERAEVGDDGRWTASRVTGMYPACAMASGCLTTAAAIAAKGRCCCRAALAGAKPESRGAAVSTLDEEGGSATLKIVDGGRDALQLKQDVC